MLQRTIMAVGAHADDHELHIGGTLAKYHSFGYKIAYVMATNNMSGGWAHLEDDGSITTRIPEWREIMPQRMLETEAAARALGTVPVYLMHPQRHYIREDGVKVQVQYGSEPPACVPPNVPTILTAAEDEQAVQRVVDLIHEHNPEAILTHGMPMVNPEHFGTCILVAKAYQRAVQDGYGGMLLYWQDLGVHTHGEAYLHWDTFIDTSSFWEQKLELSGLHACQKPDPARLDWPDWGPACGCAHAEVFTLAGRGAPGDQRGAFTLEILNNETRRNKTGTLYSHSEVNNNIPNNSKAVASSDR